MVGWKDGAEQSYPCADTLLARKHAVHKAREQEPFLPLLLRSTIPRPTYLDQPREISFVVNGEAVVVAARPGVPEAAPTLFSYGMWNDGWCGLRCVDVCVHGTGNTYT